MTTFLKVLNRAFSTLASGVNAGATTWPVATGEGVKFPSTYPFHVTCEDEIVECTNRVADALTVTRAQEGTAAVPHVEGKLVRLHITAAIIQQLQDHEPLDSGVHGVGASKVCSEAEADSKIATHTTPSAHHTAITPAGVDTKIATHGTSGKHRWTLNKIRVGAGPGADPSEASVPTPPSFGLIAGSRLMSAATGSVNYGGISFTPQACLVIIQSEWGDHRFSIGMVGSTLNRSIRQDGASGAWKKDTAYSIRIEQTSNAGQKGIITPISNGVNIYWTKMGSPSAYTAYFYILCFG